VGWTPEVAIMVVMSNLFVTAPSFNSDTQSSLPTLRMNPIVRQAETS